MGIMGTRVYTWGKKLIKKLIIFDWIKILMNHEIVIINQIAHSFLSLRSH